MSVLPALPLSPSSQKKLKKSYVAIGQQHIAPDTLTWDGGTTQNTRKEMESIKR